jgi:hypothetical protein
LFISAKASHLTQPSSTLIEMPGFPNSFSCKRSRPKGL